jgi:hypothetical protein
MIVPQRFVWVKQFAVESYRLDNICGIKVWLYRSQDARNTWTVAIGDEYRDKIDASFPVRVAQRVALNKTLGYLRDFALQLEQFRQ